MENPATSYVAATFHPTIGERAHQSLSNNATPELGMIPPTIRVNAGLHIAKGHNQQTNTAGFNRTSIDGQSRHSPRFNPCMPAAKQELHRSVMEARQPGTPPNKIRAKLKPIRQHGVVLGPIMAKTTQLQPKPGCISNPTP